MTAGAGGGDPVLDARIGVDRGGFRLDATLRVAGGEVVALLGPNGAGKTTVLRALAGLIAIDAGRISLAGTVLDDPASRTWIPPERRGIGLVFQDYMLFPHLSALDNVAFGPRRRGLSRRAARELAGKWLGMVGLADHAQRKPQQLSGGQAQRVALARALAVAPSLLLLDEPLAALDVSTKMDTRGELHRHLSAYSGATLLVTHDPLDAMVLADRLAIIENGVVVQEGDPATIAARPRTEYVARLVGLNLFRGQSDGHQVQITATGDFTLISRDIVQGAAFVAFAPSAVAVYPQRPEGSPRNVWPATVTQVQRYGDSLRVQLSGPITVASDLTPAAAAQLNLLPGCQVWAAIKAAETRSYPAAD